MARAPTKKSDSSAKLWLTADKLRNNINAAVVAADGAGAYHGDLDDYFAVWGSVRTMLAMMELSWVEQENFWWLRPFGLTKT